MVRRDATFLVLNAGSYEIIFYRNRAERTLYLGFIDTATTPSRASEPGYFQVHIGLYIASIRDAIDRATQMRACENSKSFPLSWTAYVGHHLVKQPDAAATYKVNIEQVVIKYH